MSRKGFLTRLANIEKTLPTVWDGKVFLLEVTRDETPEPKGFQSFGDRDVFVYKTENETTEELQTRAGVLYPKEIIWFAVY